MNTLERFVAIDILIWAAIEIKVILWNIYIVHTTHFYIISTAIALCIFVPCYSSPAARRSSRVIVSFTDNRGTEVPMYYTVNLSLRQRWKKEFPDMRNENSFSTGWLRPFFVISNGYYSVMVHFWPKIGKVKMRWRTMHFLCYVLFSEQIEESVNFL